MEPFGPKLIEALKAQTPGLTDETIARIEMLIGRQQTIIQSPEGLAGNIPEDQLQPITEELNSLIEREIPEFRSILQQFYAGNGE